MTCSLSSSGRYKDALEFKIMRWSKWNKEENGTGKRGLDQEYTAFRVDNALPGYTVL
jgi:hypothetical protein